jgi:hypothetical protein
MIYIRMRKIYIFTIQRGFCYLFQNSNPDEQIEDEFEADLDDIEDGDIDDSNDDLDE